jgi:hydrogenase maturation protein HypF
LELPGCDTIAIQHHHAHVASVLAERHAWEKRVLGVSFDGTGHGEDGTIWGGEIFAGSVVDGFQRVVHLRQAAFAGGDAAARSPVQAAAGFLAQLHELPDLAARPFCFPRRYNNALSLLHQGLRSFQTTSMGRLFDTAAALLGFTREVTFEGQAAIWLEHLAGAVEGEEFYPFPLNSGELDFRPLLAHLAFDRARGRNAAECARAFHSGVAHGLSNAVRLLCQVHAVDTIVLSGGVFQNQLLLQQVKRRLDGADLAIWMNQAVPPNDGGISLGQAALAAFRRSDQS